MLRRSLFVALLALVPVALPAQETTRWESDSAHSAAQFEVRHMMVSTVRGAFREVEATLVLDEKSPSNSKVEARIPAATVDTRNDKRDTHLRSADFFDAEKHPSITFVSTTVKKKAGNAYSVDGKLTIRGVTRPVTLDVKTSEVVKNPFTGTPTMGAHATATINRKDFGLTWNKALEAGGLLVGDEVKLVLDVEFVRAAEEQAVK